jgi:DNA-binding transcriptional MerR regulator
MKIGELSKKSGVAPSAIRYYEEQGLLAPISRTVSGYREYAGDAMRRLYWIQKSKSMGFSLDDIRNMFVDKDKCSKDRTLTQAANRLREIEAQQQVLAQQHQDLIALRAMLQGDDISEPCRSYFTVN